MSDHPAAAELKASEFPDNDARRRLAGLVGIDDLKERLAKSIELILDAKLLDRWTATKNEGKGELAAYFRKRQPLFLLVGDVGTGKTELAETIGDLVARESDLPITLYRMSLSSRGSGLVGEMTKLITGAFDAVVGKAQNWKSKAGTRAGAILLIDEADALAQSRETAEMHHEDRAGVNALIRGIDDLTRAQLPVVVLMATNRLTAMDPAVRRRAADILEFKRPGPDERKTILRSALGHAIPAAGIDDLVKMTGKHDGRIGFTYSDITQRLLPNILLRAIPDKTVSISLVHDVLKDMQPTPAFRDESH